MDPDQIEWDLDANLPLYTRDWLKYSRNFVLGYRVGPGRQLYHPDDVEIVLLGNLVPKTVSKEEA